MKLNEIKWLLPEVFQRTLPEKEDWEEQENPLLALLKVMEVLHAPSEEALAQIDLFFNLYLAPDHFVPFLARWVDLERFLSEAPDPAGMFPPGLGRLRELIAAAAYLSKWRGTAEGLRRFLETATGIDGFAIDEEVPGANGRPRAFHIRVRAPEAARRYQALIERIVELEKPAYVTHEIVYQAEQGA